MYLEGAQERHAFSQCPIKVQIKYQMDHQLAGTANSEPLSVFLVGICIDFAAATNALLLRERGRRSGGRLSHSVSHSASRHLCTRDNTTQSRSDVRVETRGLMEHVT